MYIVESVKLSHLIVNHSNTSRVGGKNVSTLRSVIFHKENKVGTRVAEYDSILLTTDIIMNGAWCHSNSLQEGLVIGMSDVCELYTAL